MPFEARSCPPQHALPPLGRAATLLRPASRFAAAKAAERSEVGSKRCGRVPPSTPGAGAFCDGSSRADARSPGCAPGADRRTQTWRLNRTLGQVRPEAKPFVVPSGRYQVGGTEWVGCEALESHALRQRGQALGPLSCLSRLRVLRRSRPSLGRGRTRACCGPAQRGRPKRSWRSRSSRPSPVRTYG